jgi:uncharacterized phage protein gp47/JayE
MAGVDLNGFTIKTLEEIRDDLGARLVARFGNAFDTSPESPDGQQIGVMSDVVYDAWQMGELAFNSYAPSKTFGLGLDNLCELNHVRRLFQKPTTITAKMGGSNGVIIPMGSLVADAVGLEFATASELTLDSSTDNAVTAVATVAGPNVVLANTVTKIVTTGILGWDTVNNPEAGATGNDRETDPQLRNRRAASVVTTSTGTGAAFYAALSRIGATFIVVIDNDTGGVVDGQPANSVQCVVEEGSQTEVAAAIASVKPYGIQAFGDVETTITDQKGHPKIIGFSRTTRVDIFVTVDLVRNKGATFDSADRVIAVLLEHLNNLDVSQDVIWSDIFEPITIEVENISIKSLTIGTSASPVTIADILLGIKERARTDAAKVVVNDLTP